MSTADAASAAQLPFVAAAVASLFAGAACDSLVDREVLQLTTARKLMQGIACLGPAACVLALAAGGASSRDAAEDIFICALFCQVRTRAPSTPLPPVHIACLPAACVLALAADGASSREVPEVIFLHALFSRVRMTPT
jgi:hypothetical protein